MCVYREEEPKILFDQTKKKFIAYTQNKNVLTQFKKSPIILECYSSRKNKTFLVYLNLQCCYENPCTLLRRKILRPAWVNFSRVWKIFWTKTKEYCVLCCSRSYLKKNTTLWLPGFFLVCVSYKKISTKNFLSRWKKN